ncbi:transposase [Pseudarthrobacter siccitolerans]|uniref:Transposase n=1 Tax=Pseudarthrobacter siccitolerans TaxID=861266 RepID=A0ABU0PJ61_9MICC|nr:transposase [Pseudarthrobacter siccitolerans]MDQ0674003.1 transposase [Pseudarthrobacter siccitolerans]
MLLLKANENLSERGRHRLAGVFAADDPTGSLEAAWRVKEQLRSLLNTSSLEDVGAAKNALADLVARAAMPETNRLYRTVCRWWKEIEVLIVTGATTAKVEADNTAIKTSSEPRAAIGNRDNYKSHILFKSAARNGSMSIHLSRPFPGNLEEPL